MSFSYDEMITRNIGFVTEEEQEKLRAAHVFIGGVGGMGGVAVNLLARMGVGKLTFADIDVFEISNLNRQVFANLDTVDKDKALTTQAGVALINPECKTRVLGREWTDELPALLGDCQVAINGCDDVKATLKLMRAARGKRVVVDAFAATLPSVYVVSPNDARPEEVFGYPSVGKEIDALTPEEVALCGQREIEWVMAFSSSKDHVVMEKALEMVSGKRKRISFAPMVWMTGCLMAYEAARVILDKSGGPTVKGWFVNPWEGRVEKAARGPFSRLKLGVVRRVLQKMLAD